MRRHKGSFLLDTLLGGEIFESRSGGGEEGVMRYSPEAGPHLRVRVSSSKVLDGKSMVN